MASTNDTFVQFVATGDIYAVTSSIGPVIGFVDVNLNNTVLLFAGLLGVTILLRILLANIPKVVFVNSFINENIIGIVIGCILGGIFRGAGYSPLIYAPILLVLVSMVIFDDGFCTEREFKIWSNMSRIILFGFCSTVITTFGIGLLLWAVSILMQTPYTLVQLLMFASLISALDPLSVLPMMRREQGHRNLCLSEALMNPIVSISLFLLFLSIDTYTTNPPFSAEYFFIALGKFAYLFIGPILLGFLMTILSLVVTHFTHRAQIMEPLILALCPVICFILSQSLLMSGPVAVLVTGLLLGKYAHMNISEKSFVTFRNGVRLVGSTADTALYIIVGLAFTRVQHSFDWALIGFSLFFIITFRLIITVPLTLLDTLFSFIIRRPRISIISHAMHIHLMPRSTITIVLALLSNYTPFATAALMITLLSILFYTVLVPIIGLFTRVKHIKVVDEQQFQQEQFHFDLEEIQNALAHLISLEKSKNTIPNNEEFQDMEVANIRALRFVLETIVAELDRFVRTQKIKNENMLYAMLEDIHANDLQVHKRQWEAAEKFGSAWYNYMDRERMNVSVTMSDMSYVLYVIKRRISNFFCDADLRREKAVSPGTTSQRSRTPMTIREPSWMIPISPIQDDQSPKIELDPVLGEERYLCILQILIQESIIKFENGKYVCVENDTQFVNYLYQIAIMQTSDFLLNEIYDLMENCRLFLRGKSSESAELLMTSGIAQLQAIVDEMERRNATAQDVEVLHVEENQIVNVEPIKRGFVDRVIEFLLVRKLRKEETAFMNAVNLLQTGENHRERKMALEVAKRLLRKNRVNMHRIWEDLDFDLIKTRGRSNIVIPRGVTIKERTTCEEMIRHLTELCSIQLEREKVKREIEANQPTRIVPKRILSDDTEDDIDTFGCPSPKIKRTSSSLKHSMVHVRTASYSIMSPKDNGLYIRTDVKMENPINDNFSAMMIAELERDLEYA